MVVIICGKYEIIDLERKMLQSGQDFQSQGRMTLKT